jgi:hypothetical protein
MKTITRTEAANIIRSTNGKMFTASFIKKTGEVRKMNARLQVTKHLAGGESTIKHKANLIGCYDVQSGGYRCINSDTLLEVKANGQVYKVEDK